MYLLTASQGHSQAPEYRDPADEVTPGGFRGGMHFFKPTHTPDIVSIKSTLDILGVNHD